MKSLKQLFHKEEEPTKPELEQSIIDLTDLDKLENATEEQIVLAIQKDQRLSERRESLSRYLHKLELKPLEVVEEKIVRKQKLNRILVLISEEIHVRQQKQVLTKFKTQKDWNKENIPKLLPNIRFATKDIRLLHKGMLSIDVISWNTPENTTITIGSTKFDLMKIHPSQWQNAIAHKFSPMFFQVSGGIQTGAVRDNKPMKRWRSGNESFAENKKIKLVSPVYLMLMLV